METTVEHGLVREFVMAKKGHYSNRNICEMSVYHAHIDTVAMVTMKTKGKFNKIILILDPLLVCGFIGIPKSVPVLSGALNRVAVLFLDHEENTRMCHIGFITFIFQMTMII